MSHSSFLCFGGRCRSLTSTGPALRCPKLSILSGQLNATVFSRKRIDSALMNRFSWNNSFRSFPFNVPRIKMRRPLSRLRFCFLCAVFAQGVGMLCAVQSASMRPPDAASASEGFSTPTSPRLTNPASGVFRPNGRETASRFDNSASILFEGTRSKCTARPRSASEAITAFLRS